MFGIAMVVGSFEKLTAGTLPLPFAATSTGVGSAREILAKTVTLLRPDDRARRTGRTHSRVPPSSAAGGLPGKQPQKAPAARWRRGCTWNRSNCRYGALRA